MTYRDRAPLRIVTAEVEVWLVPPTILVAEFSGAPRGGLAPLTVSFADESTISTGAITVWKWDFGDGAISTGQNPTHVYQALEVCGRSKTVYCTGVAFVLIRPAQTFYEARLGVRGGILNVRLSGVELPAIYSLKQ